MSRSPARDRTRAAAAVAAVTALAVAARLWALGWRVAHQDEARVADWILHYMQSGHWEYRAIIHGPFIPHVNGAVFSVFGPSDFTARLVVALVGGLLPAAAWLLRDRLRDAELVALAAFLAVNPLLLYYSRFMRNDVLVAAFSFLVVAAVVRAIDTDDPRYLHIAFPAAAMALAAKETALVYPAAWGGALALLLDHRLFEARAAGGSALAAVAALAARTARGLRDAWRHLLAGVGEFFALVVAFYAPKPDLYEALGNPSRLPGVVEAATLGSWDEFTRTWGSSGEHPYIPYFFQLNEMLLAGGLALVAFAALGFLVDRYGGGRRDAVSFFAYWGAAGVVGYPLAVDNAFPWEMVYVAAPLAVPAAVGVAAVYRRGVRYAPPVERPAAVVFGLAAAVALYAGAFLAGQGAGALVALDPLAVVALLAFVGALALIVALGDLSAAFPTGAQVVSAAAVVVLLVSAVHAGGVAYDTSYAAPQSPDNPLVQYAQPAGEMQPRLAQVDRIAERNDGVDVLFFGDDNEGCGDLLVQPTETWRPPEDPPCGWFSRLPLPWYFSAGDVTTGSATTVGAVANSSAPVVVALAEGSRGGPDNSAEDAAPVLDAYSRFRYQQYLSDRELVFFVHENATGTAAVA
jgi:uncharacterized protein (TIGR03663 family)